MRLTIEINTAEYENTGARDEDIQTMSTEGEIGYRGVLLHNAFQPEAVLPEISRNG